MTENIVLQPLEFENYYTCEENEAPSGCVVYSFSPNNVTFLDLVFN